MNVTITGDLGSGKSTLARLMHEDGWDVVNAGEIFRREALARGMTVQELTDVCATDPTLDNLIDRQMAEMGRASDHTVFESRLAFHFVPDSLKVYLSCSAEVAALRVLYANRLTERYSSLEEAQSGLVRRQGDERERFLGMYGIDLSDMSNYDVVIRTEYRTPEEVRDILAGANLLRDRVNGLGDSLPFDDEGAWWDHSDGSLVLTTEGSPEGSVVAYPADGTVWLPDGVVMVFEPEVLEGAYWKGVIAGTYEARRSQNVEMTLASLGARQRQGRGGRRA